MIKQMALVIVFIFSLANMSWASLAFPEKIMIMGQELHLKDQQGDAQRGFIAEYIPDGSTWDNYKILFAIRFIPGENRTPGAYAQSILDEVLKRKLQGDLLANGLVFENKDGSAATDFLISEDKGKFYEHNFWLFHKMSQGMIDYQIARRVYSATDSSDDMKKFIKDIPTLRKQILDDLQVAAMAVKLPFDAN